MITITKIKSPKLTSDGRVDLEIEVNGKWLPFTAGGNDIEQHGRDLFTRAMAGEFGVVAEYSAPVITAADAAKNSIIATETAQTPRRIREALLEIADKVGADCTFLRNLDANIAAERVKIK